MSLLTEPYCFHHDRHHVLTPGAAAEGIVGETRPFSRHSSLSKDYPQKSNESAAASWLSTTRL